MKQFIIIICHMILIIGEALTKNFENKLCRNSPVTSWANARVKLHDLTFPDLTCPDLTSPYLTCPDLTCPDLTCPNLICPDLTCPDLTCPELTCPDLICPQVEISCWPPNTLYLPSRHHSYSF